MKPQTSLEGMAEGPMKELGCRQVTFALKEEEPPRIFT